MQEPIPAPYNPDSETSKATAKSVSLRTKSSQVKRIVQALTDAPNGLTADEIEVKSGETGETLRIDSIRPRLAWLLSKQVVYKTDEKRLTRFKKPASVWRLSPPVSF